MAIANGIICAWPSTAASIPSGWSRETNLDGYYIRGQSTAGNADLLSVNGSTTHNHTSPSHTPTANSHYHSVQAPSNSSANSGGTTGSGVTPSRYDHGHSGSASSSASTSNSGIAITVNSTSNDLAYVSVIWIKSDGTPVGFPDGAYAFVASDGIHSNWTRVHDDHYLKGATGGADGSATETGSNEHLHISPAHTHLGSTHTHSGSWTSSGSTEQVHVDNVGAGIAQVAQSGHTHTIAIRTKGTTTNQSVTTTLGNTNHEPTFTQLNIIENETGGDDLQSGMVALWGSTHATIPTDWSRLTSMDSRFVKGTGADGEVGTTGGSSVHNHTASSCQPVPNSHSHGVGTSAPSTTLGIGSISGSNWGASNHGHNGQWLTNLTHTNNSASVTINNCSSEAAWPQYKKPIFVRYDPPTVTVAPTVLTITASVQSPTVNIVSNVTINPAVLTITANVIAPTVDIVSNVTITPGALTINASLQAVTIDIVSNVTITPSVLTIVSSVETPSLTIDSIFSASTLSVTTALQAPSLQIDKTFASPVLTITASVVGAVVEVRQTVTQQDITTAVEAPVSNVIHLPPAIGPPANVIAPSLQIDTTVTPSVLTATASVVAPTPKVLIEPATLDATTSVQAPNLTIDSTQVVSELNITASVVSAGIVIAGLPSEQSANTSVNSPTIIIQPAIVEQTATASVQAPGVEVRLEPSTLGATTSAQAPTVSVEESVTVAVSVLNITASIEAVSIEVRATASELGLTSSVEAATPAVQIEPSAEDITSSTQAPTVDITGDMTIAVSVLDLTASVEAPAVAVQVSASELVINSSVEAPTVEVRLEPAELNITSALQPIVMDMVQNITIEAPVCQAYVFIQLPTTSVSESRTVTPSTLSITSSLQAVGVEVRVEAAAQGASAGVQAPSVSGSANVSVGVQNIGCTLVNTQIVITKALNVLDITSQILQPSLALRKILDEQNLTISLPDIGLVYANTPKCSFKTLIRIFSHSSYDRQFTFYAPCRDYDFKAIVRLYSFYSSAERFSFKSRVRLPEGSKPIERAYSYNKLVTSYTFKTKGRAYSFPRSIQYSFKTGVRNFTHKHRINC